MKPNRNRLTILEWAPAADALYTFTQDPLHGYTRREKGAIQIGQGVKLRPDIQAYYAGGKATNVARVLDRLLDPQTDRDLWDEKNQTFRVELVTLLPDTPAGRFIGDLQRTEINRVQLRFLDAPGEARICVNLADPGSNHNREGLVEFNLSPYVVWENATDAMLEKVMEIAAEIASKAPLAIYGCKRMINYARDHSTAQGLDYIGIWNASMLQPEEMLEAITANAEKRPGDFVDLPAFKNTVEID